MTATLSPRTRKTIEPVRKIILIGRMELVTTEKIKGDHYWCAKDQAWKVQQ